MHVCTVYVPVYVLTCVSMHMCVCRYVCMRANVSACVWVCVGVCMCVCVYRCMCLCVRFLLYRPASNSLLNCLLIPFFTPGMYTNSII